MRVYNHEVVRCALLECLIPRSVDVDRSKGASYDKARRRGLAGSYMTRCLCVQCRVQQDRCMIVLRAAEELMSFPPSPSSQTRTWYVLRPLALHSTIRVQLWPFICTLAPTSHVVARGARPAAEPEAERRARREAGGGARSGTRTDDGSPRVHTANI